MYKLYFSLIILFLISVSAVFSQPWAKDIDINKDNFFNVQKSFNQYWEGKEPVKGRGYKPFKRWEYFWQMRTFPDGKIPNAIDVYSSYLRFLNGVKPNDQLLELQSDWKEMGPVKVPNNKLSYSSGGLGRLNVVRIHPTNSNIIWVGSAGGGAWYTTDKGISWTVANFTDILSIGVSDIAFAPSNPDIMYLSTGDKNGFFMTNDYSIGILKSTNGGKNWAITSEFYKPEDFYLANRIIVHPTNPNLVYAATNKGILRSKNGASSWQNINNTAIFRDLAFKPDNPQIIYATTSGMNQGVTNGRIFRSINGGDSWTMVYSADGSARLELGVTPANPNYVYVAGATSYLGGFYGLLRSTDEGANFKLMSSTPNILSTEVDGSDNAGQGFYDLALAVSPFNPEMVFVGGVHAWKSTNGGTSWKILNHWTGSFNLPFVHADQHNFVINPFTLELYAANDGGLYTSSDNGVSWKDISSGLAIAQYYKIDVSSDEPEMIIGGAQDNGSQIYVNNTWSQVNGGDGMQCAIDPINPTIVYSSTQYGNIFRSMNSGLSFSWIAGPSLFQKEAANWVTPFVLNPKNPASLFVGLRNIYKTTNRGGSWVKLTSFNNTNPVNNLVISEKDTNILYISVNNFVYKSVNGGANWNSIFNKSMFVSALAVDPENADRVFVALSGYTDGEKVYEINGTQIKNITFNLPNIPVNTIVIQKNTAGRLFIGTDIGVMLKTDDFTNSWNVFSEKLPPVVISDLKIKYDNGKMYAGTYGRGVWASQIYDCNITKPDIKITGNTEFCSGDSVILETTTNYKDFKWSTGDTVKKITVKTPGVYFVSVKDESGCSDKSDAVTVEVLSVPTFKIFSPKGLVICGDDSLSINLPIGLSKYKWSTGDTTRGIKVIEPGYYKATAETSSGCEVIDSVYIPMRSKPDKPEIYRLADVLSTDSAYSYKWYVDDKEIPNSNSRELQIPKLGNYFVVVYNEFGCTMSSDIFKVTTSVQMVNQPQSKFLISPNPFSNFIRISSSEEINSTEFMIVDVLGRTLITDFAEKLTSGQDLILNVEKIPQGSYILLIKSKEMVYSFNIRKLN